MTHFPSPPEDACVRHILRLNPQAGRALMTLEPTRMVASDALAVFEAGWSERDLHDAVLTVDHVTCSRHSTWLLSCGEQSSGVIGRMSQDGPAPLTRIGLRTSTRRPMFSRQSG